MTTPDDTTTVTKAQLRADLKTAMLAREKVRTRTIRAILTAVTEAEVAGDAAIELDPTQVRDVVVREAKKRREAAEAYTAAGREELADKEREESAVLADYLPQQLSAEEITALVAQVIAETGAAGAGMKAMGQVMAKLTPVTKGRADGSAVAAAVRAQLTGQ